MDYKICNICKKEKPLDEFYQSGGRRRASCKGCYNQLPYAKSKKSFTMIDKKQKKELKFETLEKLANDMLDLDETVESKQFEANIIPTNTNKWCGMAVIGDMHFGDYRQDLHMINNHTQLILETDNVFAIQIGDLLHEEGSITHRGKSNRPSPKEFPMNVARKACKKWATKIGIKLAAFIIGNHDERSINAVAYDFGEEMVEVIDGAYLGFGGLLYVKFNDDLIYTVMLEHYGSGYSQWNPLHSAAKANIDMPFDMYVFGHIHDGIHFNDLGKKMGKRVGAVRAGGYERRGSRYGWKVNPGGYNIPETPIVLFNPFEKEYIIFRKLERGLLMLKALNYEENDE